MDELKAQAEELGIKVDGRWSEERLQSEIDKVLSQEVAVAEEQEQPVAEAEAEAEADQEDSVDDDQPEPEPEAEEQVAPATFTIKNLRANPIKSLGLAGYGERTFTELELTDPRRMARIRRAVELGVLKVTE